MAHILKIPMWSIINPFMQLPMIQVIPVVMSVTTTMMYPYYVEDHLGRKSYQSITRECLPQSKIIRMYLNATLHTFWH